VNRADRLARELPAGLKDRAAELATLPAAQVDLIIGALRSAHREGREHERQVRRQRRADASKYHHYDEEQLADRTAGVLEATALRAAGLPTRSQRNQAAAIGAEPAATNGNLDALAALARFKREIPGLEEMAVAGLRARGDVSDTEIGMALGYDRAFARQAVGQRFGRKSQAADCSDHRYTGQAGTGGPA